jgi:hypothetical protein
MPITEQTPVAVLRAESALVEIWPNRLAPMKSRDMLPVYVDGVLQAGHGYVLRLEDRTIEQLVRLLEILPEAPDLEVMHATAEVLVSEEHVEGIV